jgi:hypothetical protein
MLCSLEVYGGINVRTICDDHPFRHFVVGPRRVMDVGFCRVVMAAALAGLNRTIREVQGKDMKRKSARSRVRRSERDGGADGKVAPVTFPKDQFVPASWGRWS